jgi:hypothetical protein
MVSREGGRATLRSECRKIQARKYSKIPLTEAALSAIIGGFWIERHLRLKVACR